MDLGSNVPSAVVNQLYLLEEIQDLNETSI